MKNLHVTHVIPTDKPSRLVEILQFNLSSIYSEQYKQLQKYKNKNISITNDEEIKEGDYGLGFALGIKGVGRGLYVFKQDGTNIGKLNAICNESKKIILTTDQDLIKDGVQAIDDEFLEWFIKNPSCEFVETKRTFEGNSFVHIGKTPSKNERLHGCYDNGKQIIGKWKELYSYKIIIPQEEPKQTAVEWYSQQHLKLLIKLENKELSIGEYAVQYQEILNKAKEMEKQRIKNEREEAYNNGYTNGQMNAFTN